MRKTRSIWLLVLLAVYLVPRVLALLTNFDKLAIPIYELVPMGLLAQISQSGWRGVPLVTYYDNCGGHLMVGLLAAPIYKVIGPSYLALKIVPLVLGMIDIVLIWDITRRLFGRRAALVASLAFAFGPQTLVVYSMLAKGNHFEGLTLQWFVAWLWVRGYQSNSARAWWIATAFTAGFAVFGYFGAMLWVALIALTHWIVRGFKRGGLELAAGALPFTIGVAPVLWVELATGQPSRVFNTFFEQFTPLERLHHIFQDVLPNAAGFASVGDIDGGLLNRLMLLLFYAAWILLFVVHCARVRARGAVAAHEPRGFRRLQRHALLPFLGYLPLFICAALLTTPKFAPYEGVIKVGQFRYLVPHFAFSCVLFGALAGWAGALSIRWKRVACSAIAMAPILIGMPMVWIHVDWSFRHFGEGFRYPGYDYAHMSRLILRQGRQDPESGAINWDFDRLRADFDEFQGPARKRVAFGLGHDLAFAQSFEKRVMASGEPNLQYILDSLPHDVREQVARGIGAGLLENWATTRNLKRTLQSLLAIDPLAASHVVEGLSCLEIGGLSRVSPRTLQRSRSLGAKIPTELHGAWIRGQGRCCGVLLSRGLRDDLDNVRVFVMTLPEEVHELFWEGAEQAWYALPGENRDFAPMRRDLEAAVVRTLESKG